MASFGWRTLSAMAYEALRFEHIEKVEGLKLKIYLDSDGVITVGYGFNIEDSTATQNQAILSIFYPDDNFAIYLEGDQYYADMLKVELAKSWTSSTLSTLQANLDAVMAQRATDENIFYSNKKSEFSFNDSDHTRKTFETVASGYEASIDIWVGQGNNIPHSSERVVLFSLAYNQQTVNPLLGPGLKSAIESGNRAEAWYEIRYNSNGDENDGIARRRFFESDEFGLYNPGRLDEAEARQIFEMVTDRETNIESYKTQYGGEISIANSTNQFGQTLLTLEQSLESAKDFLQELYTDGDPVDNILIYDDEDPATIDRTTEDDWQQEGNLILDDESDRTIITGYEDDRIYADGGNDVINPGGGNNVVFGGDGEDTAVLLSGNAIVRVDEDNDSITLWEDPSYGVSAFENTELLSAGSSTSLTLLAGEASSGALNTMFSSEAISFRDYDYSNSGSDWNFNFSGQSLSASTGSVQHNIDLQQYSAIRGSDNGDIINGLSHDNSFRSGYGDDVALNIAGRYFYTGGDDEVTLADNHNYYSLNVAGNFDVSDINNWGYEETRVDGFDHYGDLTINFGSGDTLTIKDQKFYFRRETEEGDVIEGTYRLDINFFESDGRRYAFEHNKPIDDVGGFTYPSPSFEGSWQDDYFESSNLYSWSFYGYGGNDVFVGGSKNDAVYMGDGDDRVSGGNGDNNSMSGGRGADHFIISNRNGGTDTIYDFDSSVEGEVIDLGEFNFSSFAEVSENITYNGSEASIDLGGGQVLYTWGIPYNSFTPDDFMFEVLPNTPPSAEDDSFDLLNGENYSGNVLTNDNDADGDELIVTAEMITTEQGGTVVMQSNGDFTYTAPVNFTGSDSFNYTLSDGRSGSDIGTATLNNVGNTAVEHPGTPSDDVMAGSAVDDIFIGGAGNDTVTYAAAIQGVDVDLDAGTATGDGNDSLVSIENITGSAHDDNLTGDENDNALNGGEGNDSYTPGEGRDNIYDISDSNVLYIHGHAAQNLFYDYNSMTDLFTVYDNALTPIVKITGQSSFTAAVFDDGSSYSFNRLLRLSPAPDTDTPSSENDDLNYSTDYSGQNVSGDAGNDRITGSSYSDTFNGGAGNDSIYGGSGNDALSGGAGNDRLRGGTGDDVLSGSIGDDVYFYGAGYGAETITEETGGGYDVLELTNAQASQFEIWADNNGNIHLQSLSYENDRIEIINGSEAFEEIKFADGSGLRVDDILSGDDPLAYLFAANDFVPENTIAAPPAFSPFASPTVELDDDLPLIAEAVI